MTPEERAEKLEAIGSSEHITRDGRIQLFAAEIRAAVEERSAFYEAPSEWFKRRKAEAYEDAAKIAETGTSDSCGDSVAKQIRARAKEVCK